MRFKKVVKKTGKEILLVKTKMNLIDFKDEQRTENEFDVELNILKIQMNQHYTEISSYLSCCR